MFSWFCCHNERLRLLQSLQDEVAVLQTRLSESSSLLLSKDSQLTHLQSQNEHLLRRALEAEARRDSEGNGYRLQLEDMRKQMDWMARLVGKGPIFERQLSEGTVEPLREVATMDDIMETFDPDAKAAFEEWMESGKEFLKELEADA